MYLSIYVCIRVSRNVGMMDGRFLIRPPVIVRMMNAVGVSTWCLCIFWRVEGRGVWCGRRYVYTLHDIVVFLKTKV